jgi:hypothetical protein
MYLFSCKLVKYLFDEIPEGDISALSLASFIGEARNSHKKIAAAPETDGPIMAYLKR